MTQDSLGLFLIFLYTFIGLVFSGALWIWTDRKLKDGEEEVLAVMFLFVAIVWPVILFYLSCIFIDSFIKNSRKKKGG
jgi:predicted membrane channel-forming protein YqfA (hemolysin III family)